MHPSVCPARTVVSSVGLVVGLAAITAATSPVSAADRYWAGYQNPDSFGGTAASFHSSGNWYGLVAPTSADRVLFGQGEGSPPPTLTNPQRLPNRIHFGNFDHYSFLAGTHTYTPAATATVALMHIREGSWTFDFGSGINTVGALYPAASQGSLEVRGNTGYLHIGSPAMTASLLLTGGVTHVDNDVDVGHGHGSYTEGTLRLEGPQTLLTARQLRVGYAGGSGRLEVVDGASVRAAVGIGWAGGANNAPNSMSVLVSGEGSSILGFHNVDNGDARVAAGAAVSSLSPTQGTRTHLFVGYNWDADVLVRDSGTVWDGIEGLVLGGNAGGHGKFKVMNGASVSAQWAVIGNWSPRESRFEVYGPQTTAAFTYDMNVGDHGPGTLIVDNDGLLTCGNATVGLGDGARGMATVSAGSLWDLQGTLAVGDAGRGELNIVNGRVESGGGWTGHSPGADGNVTLTGTAAFPATWAIAQSLQVGGSGRGHLRIGEHCTVSVGGQLIVASGGRVSGRGIVNGNVVVSGGTLSSESSTTDVLMINGSYSQNGGVVQVDLRDVPAGAPYGLAVTGPVAISNAQLVVTLPDGHVPEVGDSFQLIGGAGSRSLSFTSVQLMASGVSLPPEFGVDLSQLAATGTVTLVRVPAPCAGDFNRSGDVTVQDIFDFLAAYFAGCP